MIKIKFNNEYFLREVAFSMKGPHVVEIIGIEEPNLSGFKTYRYDDESLLGDFSDYTTLYRTVDGGIQFSNDGREYPYAPSPLLVNQVSELQSQTKSLQNQANSLESNVSNLQSNVTSISETVAQNTQDISDTQDALCEHSIETESSISDIEVAICELSESMVVEETTEEPTEGEGV